MGALESQVLLHPLRMRVIVALADDELTTKEIHSRIPDVAQASLYRAVGRLVDAGLVEVCALRRRGGAIERIYRSSRPLEAAPDQEQEPVHLRAELVARALSIDAARWLSSGLEDSKALVSRLVVRLSDADAAHIKAQLEGVINKALELDSPDEAPVALSVAVLGGPQRRV